jgi:hypothetical protein
MLAAAVNTEGGFAMIESVNENFGHPSGDFIRQIMRKVDPAAPQPFMLKAMDDGVFIVLQIFAERNRVALPRSCVRSHGMGETVLQQIRTHLSLHGGDQKARNAAPVLHQARQRTEKNYGIGAQKAALRKVETDLRAGSGPIQSRWKPIESALSAITFLVLSFYRSALAARSS